MSSAGSVVSLDSFFDFEPPHPKPKSPERFFSLVVDSSGLSPSASFKLSRESFSLLVLFSWWSDGMSSADDSLLSFLESTLFEELSLSF